MFQDRVNGITQWSVLIAQLNQNNKMTDCIRQHSVIIPSHCVDHMAGNFWLTEHNHTIYMYVPSIRSDHFPSHTEFADISSPPL